MSQPGRVIRVMVCAASAGVLACGAATAATGDRARAVEPDQSLDVQIPVKSVPNGPLGEVYGTAVNTTVTPESSTRTAGPDVRGMLSHGGISGSGARLMC